MELVGCHVMVPIWDRAVVSHGQRGEVGALCKEEDAPPAVMRFACDQSVSTQDVHQRAKKYGVLRQYVYELWDTAPLVQQPENAIRVSLTEISPRV